MCYDFYLNCANFVSLVLKYSYKPVKFSLRYTGTYEGYPTPREGYGGRRYEVFYLQTIIANSLQVISPVSMIRSTHATAFKVSSSLEAALVASVLVLLMIQGKSPLGIIQLSKFHCIHCEKNNVVSELNKTFTFKRTFCKLFIAQAAI